MIARIAVLVAAIAGTAVVAPTAGVYHRDPGHLWNRVHEALFVRAGAGGEEFGRDRLEPLLWRESKHLLGGDSHQRLLAVLAEFNRGGDRLIVDPVKRAMLQRDLWLVFSWLEHSHDEFYGFPGLKADWQRRHDALRLPLARAIGGLALTPQQIAALPDNYAAAVASRAFAGRFDPRAPDRSYLPPDLFAADGPWACLGRGDDLIAPSHVLSDNPFTTSAFLVFVKLPGGRDATRAYVDRLRAFNGPLLVPTRESPAPQIPNYNPAIPQFPEGTEVALVRRALLVTSSFDVVASPLTEDVQLRVYRRVPAWTSEVAMKAGLAGDEVRAWQSFSEFQLSRIRLFAGQSGGLRAVAATDRDMLTGFSTHGIDPFEPRPGEAPAVSASRPKGGPALSLCVDCHNLPGVYSVNTYTQSFSERGDTPARLSVVPPSAALASAVRWKRQRADWILLQSLLRVAPSPSVR